MANTRTNPLPNPNQLTSRNRPRRKRVSYKEDSSESEAPTEMPSDDDYAAQPVSSPKKPSTSVISKKRNAERPSNRLSLGSVKKIKTRTVNRIAGKTEDSATYLPKKRMPLHVLPYQILVTIFDYASRPLMSVDFRATSSASWLLQVALCCRAFAEPALTVLYYSPPLAPPNRAHALRSFLMSRSKSPTFNYGAKIKYLDVEASNLSQKHGGLQPINLGHIIAYTPQLRGINIHSFTDKYRSTWTRYAGGRDVYGRSLMSAIQSSGISLQQWTWNQGLGKDQGTYTTLTEVHRTSSFGSLRCISFHNYNAGPPEGGKRREELLAKALDMLPHLREVSFRASSIVNDRLMCLLPARLRTIEIIDCNALKSPAVKDFLMLKGNDLTQIILDHNSALNLCFLSNLAASCPRLERLKMDLRYLNCYLTVRSSDPKYKTLLEEGDVPAWPTSLQTLELLYLRKLGLSAAETFFSSLTNAAKALQNLRSLRIKASLDESGWRDRIDFRDKWTSRLQHVFLRHSAPPNPHLSSFASFTSWKKQQDSGESHGLDRNKPAGLAIATRSALKDSSTFNTSPGKHAQGPVAVQEINVPVFKVQHRPQDAGMKAAPTTKVRRSSRTRAVKDDIYRIPGSSSESEAPRRRRRRRGSDESSSPDSAVDGLKVETPNQGQPLLQDANKTIHIQGMCDVVDVLIDNLRPGEEQLNENDFLDEEISGDEDWNGDDDIDGEVSYAW